MVICGAGYIFGMGFRIEHMYTAIFMAQKDFCAVSWTSVGSLSSGLAKLCRVVIAG